MLQTQLHWPELSGVSVAKGGDPFVTVVAVVAVATTVVVPLIAFFL